MITNVINRGDFQGEEAYISGKMIQIGFFKKSKSFIIDDFEPIEYKTKDSGAAPIWVGMALGGVIGGLLGAALSKSENYTRVKIRYGKKYQSILWLGEKSYTLLRESNKNTKPSATITITIEK